MGRELAEYQGLAAKEITQRIAGVRETLGKRLVILAHHYQTDEVIQHSDFRGDSLKLAQIAAREQEAEFIVFCGVHFMAETADILTSPRQKVILPDVLAGCPMADMAELNAVEACWRQLGEAYGDRFTPVTYINSNADVKAFCGRREGLVCTSSNADQVFQHVFAQGQSVMFMPDEHLGRNTGSKLGLRSEEIFLWDFRSPETIVLPPQPPRLIVWKGFCCVHQRFTPEQIQNARAEIPGIRVIVHPECPREIVALADDAGSTEYIIRKVAESPPGSAWSIGTEANMIRRLAREYPEKMIRSLNPHLSLCKNMNLLQEKTLLWALENIAAGRVVNQVAVETETAKPAALAVRRMLEL
ncbi:MAG: quinolinate synthase NadA [Peptococcaceae bacterium]|jgi:quinolinate synthase|nr:quinolinate synthase NadA [Peptococcaceae bacterium]